MPARAPPRPRTEHIHGNKPDARPVGEAEYERLYLQALAQARKT